MCRRTNNRQTGIDDVLHIHARADGSRRERSSGERVELANQGRPITYFEITTVAAFLAFARTPAEVLLLETGLGGRLDATNVLDRPALSVITPVSFASKKICKEVHQASLFTV